MNTYPSTPKLRPTLWDGVVAALVAALAIVTILCFYGRRTGAPQAVTITHRGALIQTIRLTGLTENKNRRHRRRLPSGNSGGQRRCLRYPQRLSGAGLRSHRPHHPLRPEHRLPAGAGGHPAHRRHIGRRRGVGIGGGA